MYEPSVEKSERRTSPNSSPNVPPMAMAPKTVACGSAMCTSADAMHATSTSPAEPRHVGDRGSPLEERSREERELERNAPGDDAEKTRGAVSQSSPHRAPPSPRRARRGASGRRES